MTQCIYETVGRYMGEELGDTYGQNLIHHNMVKVKRNGKYGYVNLDTGEEVIPCEYNSTTARFKKYQYLYNNQNQTLTKIFRFAKHLTINAMLLLSQTRNTQENRMFHMR